MTSSHNSDYHCHFLVFYIIIWFVSVMLNKSLMSIIENDNETEIDWSDQKTGSSLQSVVLVKNYVDQTNFKN